MTLKQVNSVIVKDKQIPRSMFMGVPSTEMTFIRQTYVRKGECL
jgi:hypothetical protein